MDTSIRKNTCYNKLFLVFSSLVINSYNFRILHWKLKGLGFDGKHELVDEYRKQLDEYIDEIAEMLLMLGKESIPNIRDLIVNANSMQDSKFLLIDGNKDYTVPEFFGMIGEVLKNLLEKYEELSDCEGLPSDIKSKLDEHTYWIRKELDYKNKQRMKESKYDD